MRFKLSCKQSICHFHNFVSVFRLGYYTNFDQNNHRRRCRSYRGHHDANFNVAILDGHKEIVAHEKFQQLLHKKWGQRDKIHYGDDIRLALTPTLYNSWIDKILPPVLTLLMILFSGTTSSGVR